MTFTEHTKQVIACMYKGRTHMEMTIGCLKDGKTSVVHLGVDGREQEGRSPCYAVGSIAKPFTASLLARHVAAGRLALDASLSNYIQQLPAGYYPPLLRLATHCSGYGGQPYTMLPALRMFMRINKPDGLFRVNPYHGTMNPAQMYNTLASTPLEDRDYKYFYSNFAFGVLGYVLGTVQGGGYWQDMQQFIREDLGLPRTRLGVTDEVVGHDRKNQPCINWQWDEEDIVAAAGALVAPIEDLLAFARQNLDGSKPYLALCHQTHGQGQKEDELGLAWRLRKNTNISWHTGAAGAYSAFIGLDRKKQTAVAAACNYGLVNMQDIGFSMLENGF